MKIERQTWDQVRIKSELGVFRGLKSFRIRFHWKFWRPLDAIGGRIYFGLYAEYDADEVPARPLPSWAGRPAVPSRLNRGDGGHE